MRSCLVRFRGPWMPAAMEKGATGVVCTALLQLAAAAAAVNADYVTCSVSESHAIS
jgi:hypothetical protein